MMMMKKRGREEEDKAMGPLFPRLHVNDAAGKAALYEQQRSVPSQRFNAPGSSSTQGCGHERSSFSSFCVSPHTSAHLAERFHFRCSEEINLNTTGMELERRPVKHMNSRTLNATGSVAEYGLPRPHNDSSAKSSSRKKVEDEDDFMVPTFIKSLITTHSSKDTAMVEGERLTPFYTRSPQRSCSAAFNSSVQFPNSNDKPLQKTSTSHMKSMKYNLNHNEEKPKETSVFREPPEKSISHAGSGEKSVVPSNFAKSSLDKDETSTSNAFQSLCYGNARSGQESCDSDALVEPRCLNDIDVINGDTLRVRNESCSQASLGNVGDKPNVSDKGKKQSDDKANGSFEMGEREKTDLYDSSMVDSIPGMEISPDDVVGVIGPKQFWRARRAIVNQQRIFALQVFELHRLIKVQKSIASSPHLLLEGKPYRSRSRPNVPTKSLSPEHKQTVKERDESQQPNQNTKCPKGNTVGVAPLPSPVEGFNKGLPGQVPRSGAYSGYPPAFPMAPNNKANPMCFHPQPNQWLVPVMSPSEGLVYKPYTGPCPPTAGFVAPIYGSFAPLSLPHQQQNINMGVLSGARNYFQTPCGLPVVNPTMSASAVEQVSPLARSRSHGHAEQHSRSSCNMSNPKSEAFSGYVQKFQASKDSELQGSTASSCWEKACKGRDVLPLFPMAPTVEGSTQPTLSCDRDNQSRVIKVVPHNARSATESAARIFRSIQQERQQYDS